MLPAVFGAVGSTSIRAARSTPGGLQHHSTPADAPVGTMMMLSIAAAIMHRVRRFFIVFPRILIRHSVSTAES